MEFVLSFYVMNVEENPARDNMNKKLRNISNMLLFLLLLSGLFFLMLDISVVGAAVIDDPLPRNGRYRISTYMDNISVVITDTNNNFSYAIETDPDIGSISEYNVESGVKTCTITDLDYNTTYTWFVNVTDDDILVNTIYTFTTKGSTDFDINDVMGNLPEYAMGPYMVYVGDFVWMFLFVGVIAIAWGGSSHISTVFIVILLTFAAYGTQRVFIDNSEVSLLFSLIAAVAIAAIMLGLFLKKGRG